MAALAPGQAEHLDLNLDVFFNPDIVGNRVAIRPQGVPQVNPCTAALVVTVKVFDPNTGVTSVFSLPPNPVRGVGALRTIEKSVFAPLS